MSEQPNRYRPPPCPKCGFVESKITHYPRSKFRDRHGRKLWTQPEHFDHKCESCEFVWRELCGRESCR